MIIFGWALTVALNLFLFPVDTSNKWWAITAPALALVHAGIWAIIALLWGLRPQLAAMVLSSLVAGLFLIAFASAMRE